MSISFRPQTSISQYNVARPVNESGERVSPEDFEAYNQSHRFSAPCCLCPHKFRMHAYTECSVLIAQDGPFLAEYMASCSTQRCNYVGALYFPIQHACCVVVLESSIQPRIFPQCHLIGCIPGLVCSCADILVPVSFPLFGKPLFLPLFFRYGPSYHHKSGNFANRCS